MFQPGLNPISYILTIRLIFIVKYGANILIISYLEKLHTNWVLSKISKPGQSQGCRYEFRVLDLCSANSSLFASNLQIVCK